MTIDDCNRCKASLVYQAVYVSIFGIRNALLCVSCSNDWERHVDSKRADLVARYFGLKYREGRASRGVEHDDGALLADYLDFRIDAGKFTDAWLDNAELEEAEDEDDDDGPDEPDPDYEHARRWDDGEGR